jgi:hypothetical protein
MANQEFQYKATQHAQCQQGRCSPDPQVTDEWRPSIPTSWRLLLPGCLAWFLAQTESNDRLHPATPTLSLNSIATALIAIPYAAGTLSGLPSLHTVMGALLQSFLRCE